MEKHNQALDGLRGIASLIVILFHMDAFFGIAFSHNNLYDRSSISWQWYRRLLDGNYAVCVFFILSGYVLLLGFKKRDLYLSFSFVKRYFRLTPLILFSTLFAFFLQQTIGFHNKELSTFIGGNEWLYNEFSIKLTFLGAIKSGIIGVYQGDVFYNSPLWTIKLELIGSLIIFSFAALFFAYKNINYITILIITFMVSVFGNNGIYLSLFLIGSFILKKNIILNKKLIIPLTFLTIFLAVENQWTPEVIWISSLNLITAYNLSLICHVIASILSLLIILSSTTAQNFFSNSFFSFLGKISFSMYVLHLPIMMSIGTLIINYSYTHHYNVHIFSAISIIFCLTLIITISYVSYNLIDKKSIKFASIIIKKILPN